MIILSFSVTLQEMKYKGSSVLHVLQLSVDILPTVNAPWMRQCSALYICPLRFSVTYTYSKSITSQAWELDNVVWSLKWMRVAISFSYHAFTTENGLLKTSVVSRTKRMIYRGHERVNWQVICTEKNKIHNKINKQKERSRRETAFQSYFAFWRNEILRERHILSIKYHRPTHKNEPPKESFPLNRLNWQQSPPAQIQLQRLFCFRQCSYVDMSAQKHHTCLQHVSEWVSFWSFDLHYTTRSYCCCLKLVATTFSLSLSLSTKHAMFVIVGFLQTGTRGFSIGVHVFYP